MKICTNKDKCIHQDGPELAISEFAKLKKAKDGLSHRCKPCANEVAREWSNANKDKRKQYRLNNKNEILESAKQYRLDNKDRIAKAHKIIYQKKKGYKLQYQKEYYQQNKERVIQYQTEYREINPEKVAQCKSEWGKNNPEKCAANAARRKSAKLQRTPKWANLKKIEKLYWVAKTLTNRTGMKWVVDHKIPLQGKNVSGMHVENNLQVITASRNLSKSNRFEPIFGIV